MCLGIDAVVCSNMYMLGSKGHSLWLGVCAGEQEPCFLVACMQGERASEDGELDTCIMVQKHLGRQGDFW